MLGKRARMRLGWLVVAAVVTMLALNGQVSGTEALIQWVGTATISANGKTEVVDFTVDIRTGKEAGFLWRSRSANLLLARGPFLASVSGSTVNGEMRFVGGSLFNCCRVCFFTGVIDRKSGRWNVRPGFVRRERRNVHACEKLRPFDEQPIGNERLQEPGRSRRPGQCRRRFDAMPKTVRRRHGVVIQVRVGLNSGEVVVRAIGSDLRMDYTAVGQTTHLAARMEPLAKPDTTLLTADVLRLAEGFIAVTPLGPVPVKA